MSRHPSVRGRQPHHSGGFLLAVQSVLYLIVVALFIISFSMQPFRIPSGSMEPTLLVGDFLLVNKQLNALREPLDSAPIEHGDIIVFYYPVESSLLLVKRVIGLPGDHIRLHEGRVYRNGLPLTEPYAVYRPSSPDSFRDNFPRMQSAEPGINSRWWIEMRHMIDHGDLVVPPSHYFVLGDNRNNSEDSRYWGLVPASAIVGKPFLVYFSLRMQGRSDFLAAPRLSASIQSEPPQESLLNRFADFARWDRAFHIVR